VHLTRSFTRRILIALAALLLLVYIALPVLFGVFAVIPAGTGVGAPPSGFEEVTLVAEDGVPLAAWYAPPSGTAAIILIHGAGGSREDLRPYAAMLKRHGYGVLAIDMRGHGMSGGATNQFGWESGRDVGAAVAFLEGREEVAAIGGMGFSLGGEVLMAAASEYPEIRAIVADGATHRSPDDLLALKSERPLYRSFTALVMYAAAGVLSGDHTPEPIRDSIVDAESTEFLLIAGGEKAMEEAFGRMYVLNADGRASLWIAPGAGHTEAFALLPDEYEGRVVAFFDEALPDGTPLLYSPAVFR
jgi:pimeloyl-ACP methyl ester carboxylesterase